MREAGVKKVLCPHCGAYSEPYKYKNAWQCGLCRDELFEQDLARGAEGVPKANPHGEVPIPRGVTIADGGDSGPFVIKCKWSRASAFGMLVSVFVLHAIGYGFSDPNTVLDTERRLGLVFLLGTFDLAALVIAAYSLLEVTQFTLDGPSLTVRSGPLPWFGNRTVEARAIVQLYVKRVDSRDATNYALLAVLGDGREVEIQGFEAGTPRSKREMARLLENLLERRLALTPARVQGEVER
jgi:hypothetical protein